MPIRQSKVLVGRHAVSSPRHWWRDNAPSANLNFRFFQRPWVEARLRSVDKSDDFVKGSVAHLLTTHFTKMQKNTMTDGEWIRAKEMVRQRKWAWWCELQLIKSHHVSFESLTKDIACLLIWQRALLLEGRDIYFNLILAISNYRGSERFCILISWPKSALPSVPQTLTLSSSQLKILPRQTTDLNHHQKPPKCPREPRHSHGRQFGPPPNQSMVQATKLPISILQLMLYSDIMTKTKVSPRMKRRRSRMGSEGAQPPNIRMLDCVVNHWLVTAILASRQIQSVFLSIFNVNMRPCWYWYFVKY